LTLRCPVPWQNRLPDLIRKHAFLRSHVLKLHGENSHGGRVFAMNRLGALSSRPCVAISTSSFSFLSRCHSSLWDFERSPLTEWHFAHSTANRAGPRMDVPEDDGGIVWYVRGRGGNACARDMLRSVATADIRPRMEIENGGANSWQDKNGVCSLNGVIYP